MPQGVRSIWAQSTLKADAGKRGHIMERLKAKGIPTMVYNPIPLNKQTAYKRYHSASNGLPNAEHTAEKW